MCCSVTAREEAKKTTPTAGPTAKHTVLQSGHTVRREGTLGGFHPCWENLRKPSKLAAATSYIGNKINSSHKGFILEHNKILYTFSHKLHNLIFGRLSESHRSSS